MPWESLGVAFSAETHNELRELKLARDGEGRKAECFLVAAASRIHRFSRLKYILTGSGPFSVNLLTWRAGTHP